MEVLVKYDVNGYPVATVLPAYFDEEVCGPITGYTRSTLEDVNRAAEINTPAPVEEI